MIGLRPLEDSTLVGGAADLEGLAVEVFATERQHLAESEPAIREDADHRLVVARRFREAVHLLEGEDADRAGLLLLRPRVVGSDANTLERVEVADFIRDRVLGHSREGAEDANRPRRGPAFDPEHVVNQGEGVTSAQLAERPILQRDALDLYVGDTADAMVVGRVGAL